MNKKKEKQKMNKQIKGTGAASRVAFTTLIFFWQRMKLKFEMNFIRRKFI